MYNFVSYYFQISDEDPIKCLAYKKSKVSTVKPSIHLTINGHFETASLMNLTRTCIPTYKTEILIKKWFKTTMQLCQNLSDVINIQMDISSSLTFTSVSCLPCLTFKEL